MKVVPSPLTVILMFVAAGVFAFNSVIAFRIHSYGRAGFYLFMALLWAILGWLLNVRRTAR